MPTIFGLLNLMNLPWIWAKWGVEQAEKIHQQERERRARILNYLAVLRGAGKEVGVGPTLVLDIPDCPTYHTDFWFAEDLLSLPTLRIWRRSEVEKLDPERDEEKFLGLTSLWSAS